MAPGPLSRDIANAADISKALAETTQREKEIHDELDALMDRSSVLEDLLESLGRETSDVLEIIRVDAEQLAQVVSSTADIAERISRDVRKLDRAQNSAGAVISYVRLISSRNSCIDGLKASMDRGDYESAVEQIQRYQDLEQRQRELLALGEADSAAAEVLVSATPDQLQVLESSRKQLSAVARAKCQEALSRGDHPTVVRFIQLYPALGLTQEGLTSFTAYLRGLIAGRAKEDYDALVDGLARTPDPAQGGALVNETLSGLFRDAAAALEENKRMLSERFGSAGVLHVMKGVNAEVEQRSIAVMRHFLEFKRIDTLVQKVSSRPRGGRGASLAASQAAQASMAEGDPLDPRNMEGSIEDLVTIIRRGEDYLMYIIAQLKDAASHAASASGGGAEGEGAPTGAEQEAGVRSGSLNVLMRELLVYFMTLEEYYMEETVFKAVRLDERIDGSLTTSMVDDVFFLLLKSSRRSIASGSIQCACAVVSQVNNVLCNQYRAALEARLQRGPGRLVASMPPLGKTDPLIMETLSLGGGRPSSEALEHAAAMNNLDVSSEYVRKLKQELGGLTERVFQGTPRERDRLEAVLSDLGKTSGDLRAWGGQCVDQLSRALQPQLRPLLDEVASVSYEITESQFARNEAEDGWWAKVLLEALMAALVWLQPLLTQSLFEMLVGSLLESVATRVESLLLQKRFNQLGGLQLDRDIRTLVSGFSDLTQRTVRDKFARLTQMSTVLCLEDVKEIVELWGEGKASVTWRLTTAEVKQIMGLRRDFRPEEIDRAFG